MTDLTILAHRIFSTPTEEPKIILQLHNQHLSICSKIQLLSPLRQLVVEQQIYNDHYSKIISKLQHSFWHQSVYLSRYKYRLFTIDDEIVYWLEQLISHLKSYSALYEKPPEPPIQPRTSDPIAKQSCSEKPKEPVKEQTNNIAPTTKIQIEIKIVSSPIPVKNVEPTIDVQPATIASVQEEPTVQIVPITVKVGNQHVQVSDVSVVQSNKTNYPITVTVDVEPPTIPIVPEVAIEIPPTGPGPPARYNLRSTQKGKKDVCCIKECQQVK
jgi:hypothetical protein